jgi:plasmid stabilization system protein ParE
MSSDYEVRFDSRANEDVATAVEWYEDIHPGLGIEFVDCVDALVEKMSANPMQFPPVSGDIRRGLTGRFPFAVYFEVDESTVWVLAVLHVRRSPETWQSR